jgi:PAS domain S-box-containing protein
MPIDKTVFEQITASDTTLVTLDLSHQKLCADDLQSLVDALGENPYLRTLNVSGNCIDLKCSELIAKIPQLDALVAIHCDIDDAALAALTQNTTFISLALANNNINGNNLKILTEYGTLTHLDVSMNQIDDEGVMVLAQHPTLDSLMINRSKIGVKGATALAQNTQLKSLDLSYNTIQAEGVAAFANNISLTALGLAGTAGGTPGFVSLAKNQALTSLDASYNQLSNTAVIALAGHSHLTKLNLSYNQIGFEGAYALGCNQKLITLFLSYNQVGDGGAIALSRNHTLQQLDLTGNRIGFEGAHALAGNANLASIGLSCNLVSDAGAVTLAHHTTLSELMLSYNAISDQGAIALAENTTLKLLNLNYNNIGQRGKQALKENKSIHKIVISEEQPPEFTAENLDTIFLLSESFICICSFNFTIEFFNPTFARLLGYTCDELLAQNYLDFFHPDDRQQAQQYLQSDQPVNPILNSETRFCCKNGTYRLIHWTSQIMHRRRYTVGVDITEKKEFEKNLIKVQEENIWLRLQESQSFNKQQTEFIAHLSHEVRNPLSGIYGEVEIIQEQISDMRTVLNNPQPMKLPAIKEALMKKTEEMNESIKQVFNCLEYQKNILEENLDSARIMEQKLILKTVSFDVSLAFKDIILMLQAKAKQKNLDIDCKVPETCLVKGDIMRLKQILTNLVSNAIKFTSQGRINIILTVQETTPQYTKVRFTVSDTGIGLSPEEIGRLFQRFSQGVGNEYQGSGLGLYIIKQLINLMGGNISLASEKDKGSTFTVIIPFDSLTETEKQQFQQHAKQPIEPFTSVHPTLSLSKLSILIVDDNALNRKILGKYFAKMPGCKCEYAANGEEALTAYDKQRFDIILMDIAMPLMDGITATQEIRKREQTKKLRRTPIIVISANALERDKVEALGAGVDAFVIKPCKKEEIFRKIAELVPNKNVEPIKTGITIAPDSPLYNSAQLREVLNTITPDKKWGVNLKKSMVWLELQGEEDALTVINHFKANHYSAIECKYKANTAVPMPVLVLKEIQVEKLKKIPPLTGPVEETPKMLNLS